MSSDKFIIQPHFRLQDWVAEEKGYFKDEGLDYVFQETVRSDGWPLPQSRQHRRVPDDRRGPQLGCELRLPLDGECRRRQRARQLVGRRLFSGARRHLRCRRIRP